MSLPEAERVHSLLCCMVLVVTLKWHAGPGKDDSYSDVRNDYEKNEVAVDYNSGFTGERQH